MLHLRDYWRTVRKRIWTLITTFCIIVGTVSVVTLVSLPVYEASSSIQIDSKPQAYRDISAMGQYGSGQYLSDQEYFNTMHKKLRSRRQARAVLERLDLYQNPVFAEADDPVELALDMISIEPVAKTRLVWLYVRSTDPQLAEQLCEAWGVVFRENNMSELRQGVDDGLSWLDGALANAEREMTEADRAVNDYRKSQQRLIVSPEERASLSSTKLSELAVAMGQMMAEYASRKAEYNNFVAARVQARDTMELSLLVASDLMDDLRTRYAERAEERKALAGRYGPEHKNVTENAARIAELEARIRGEVRAEESRRRELMSQAEQKVEGLKVASGEVTAEALDETDAEAEFNRLQRRADSTRDTFQTLRAQRNELTASKSLQENNVTVIDAAEVKVDPVEPNYVRDIGVAILGALLVGVSLALFFDYMDTTIKTREEVEALGVPFLGILPSVPDLPGDNWEAARERYLYSHLNPKSAFAECCRAIRTNINFSARADGKPPRRFLITSAGEREGKTTSSINLGITFAAAGRRVCLVDADLRRPSLHHAFGIPNEKGFSALIAGEVEVAETAIQPIPDAPNLWVVPAGPRPEQPAEMLISDVCTRALDKLNEAFDLVIIDTPPVVAVTDAAVLSNRVDGVVLVVKSFRVAKDLALQARRQLSDVDARFIGVILNDFDIRRKGYGYYYYYDYYGPDRDDKRRKGR